jgi:tetratricopeptide (TPR) repeat protein
MSSESPVQLAEAPSRRTEALVLENGADPPRPLPPALSVAQSYNRRGIDRYQAGDVTGAIDEYDAALRFYPALAEAYNNRGVAKFAQADHAGALADYSAALVFNAAYPEAYNNRGAVRHVLGDLAGAVADFDAAIRLNPDYTRAYDNRAAAHTRLFNFTGAVADYDTAIAQYGSGPRAQTRICMLLVFRGNNRYHLRDLEGAALDLLAALAMNACLYADTMVHVLEHEARACLPATLAACDRYLIENDADHITYSRRAAVMLILGRRAEAWHDLEQASLRSPIRDHPLATTLVARVGDAADVAYLDDLIAKARRRAGC